MEEAGVKAVFREDGSVQYYLFPFSENGDTVTGYKVKNPNDKADTFSVGAVSTINGIEKYRSGGKRIVITEGEEDRLAVYTAQLTVYNRTYPVVSMGSVAQTKFLTDNREVLRQFKEVILWFDNDAQGQKATAEAAKIIGYDRVKVVVSEKKDANDVLKTIPPKSVDPSLEFGSKLVVGLIWDAVPYKPGGIVSSEETWERYQQSKDRTFVPWPPFLEGLNTLSYGRTLGSITLFAAGTSIGKTSVLKEDIKFLLDTTSDQIGAVFLEDDVSDIVQGMMALYLDRRLGLPNVDVTEEEEREAWEAMLGTGRILLVDHQGSISDNRLLDQIEYLALKGCKYIYLDHITIAVSLTEERDTNKAIDQFMAELLRIVKRHNCWIGVVSHLRKVSVGEESFESGAMVSEDDLKGSGSLKQIAFTTIALSRNKLAESEQERHTTSVWLLKDRKTGATGFAGKYRYNSATGRMVAVPKELENVLDEEVEIIA